MADDKAGFSKCERRTGESLATARIRGKSKYGGRQNPEGTGNLGRPDGGDNDKGEQIIENRARTVPFRGGCSHFISSFGQQLLTGQLPLACKAPSPLS